MEEKSGTWRAAKFALAGLAAVALGLGFVAIGVLIWQWT